MTEKRKWKMGENFFPNPVVIVVILKRPFLQRSAENESRAGLPDGLFSNQKSQFGWFWEDLRLENVDIFYGHLEYFMAIWNILWPFEIIYGCMV
jgi:hypothetical protein